MHVPLGGPQIRLPGQFLNRPGRRSSHRQMRTEGVPQDVNPRDAGASQHAPHVAVAASMEIPKALVAPWS